MQKVCIKKAETFTAVGGGGKNNKEIKSLGGKKANQKKKHYEFNCE